MVNLHFVSTKQSYKNYTNDFIYIFKKWHKELDCIKLYIKSVFFFKDTSVPFNNFVPFENYPSLTCDKVRNCRMKCDWNVFHCFRYRTCTSINLNILLAYRNLKLKLSNRFIQLWIILTGKYEYLCIIHKIIFVFAHVQK